jgi:hypothetical protein
MVGLTRFFYLMNLCEKSGGSTNVHAGFSPFKKHVKFRGVKKLFVLQEKNGVFLHLRTKIGATLITPEFYRGDAEARREGQPAEAFCVSGFDSAVPAELR